MVVLVEHPITRSTLAETIWIRLEDALAVLEEEEGSEDLVVALVAAPAAV